MLERFYRVKTLFRKSLTVEGLQMQMEMAKKEALVMEI